MKSLPATGISKIIDSFTSNKIKGVLVGAAVTALIQSSSATTVMVIGFINAGIMKLGQAVGVIMGANIGTTITSFIISLEDINSSAMSYMGLLKPSFGLRLGGRRCILYFVYQ